MKPTRIALILGVLAVALSVVLKAIFDAWVADRFLFWDDDVIGFSPYAWVVGVLRDGEVSSTGLAIGWLAIGQVGVLSVWLAFVSRWTTIRR